MNVEVVLAPNPGVMTGPGTNTWILESAGESVVIDPGPEIPGHLDAVAAALEGTRPIGVVVTHGHPDHAPGAPLLAARIGVRVSGPWSEHFSPDHRLADGEVIGFGKVTLEVVATPGHTADSVSYRVGDALFTGDHIMGGSTVVVEDMSAYLQSLERLRGTGIEVIYPGHGPVVDDPERVIDAYIAHRLEREGQILAAVRAGAGTVGEVVEAVYAAVAVALHPVAAVSVDAHLRKLAAEGAVEYRGGGWNSAVTPK